MLADFVNEINIFYFTSIFILLICRKAREVPIHRTGNYQDIALWLKFLFWFLIFIEIWLKFRTGCLDHQAGKSAAKCLSLGQNRGLFKKSPYAIFFWKTNSEPPIAPG